ncbi:hypothetical protein ACOSQ2_018685 [Xanthoceras sorbifolium]
MTGFKLYIILALKIQYPQIAFLAVIIFSFRPRNLALEECHNIKSGSITFSFRFGLNFLHVPFAHRENDIMMNSNQFLTCGLDHILISATNNSSIKIKTI